MKRILIDLNVITIGSWKKADPARVVAENFMKKVEGREGEAKQFHVVTPYALLELVGKWRDKELAGVIENFYRKVTDEYVEKVGVIEELFEVFEDVYNALIMAGVKPEDAFLVMVCSVKKAVLVTFDRKHLLNKEEDINAVLRTYQCGEVEVMPPGELVSGFESGSKPFELAVVFKDCLAHPFLYFAGKLDRVNILRDKVLNLFRFCAFLTFSLHALNSYFFIYKPFHTIQFRVNVGGSRQISPLRRDKGVFWESSA